MKNKKENLCTFYLNKADKFEIPINLNILSSISKDIGNQLFDNGFYYVQSHVCNENFQLFLDFLVYNKTLHIDSDNIYEIRLLSNEFGIMKDILEESNLDNLFKLSLLKSFLKENNCNDLYPEEYLATNLDFYIQNFSHEMKKISITSLYRIFNHKNRILNDHDKAYKFIININNEKEELYKYDHFILLKSLDGSKLKINSLVDAIDNYDKHFGFSPNISTSLLISILPSYHKFKLINSIFKFIKKVISIFSIIIVLFLIYSMIASNQKGAISYMWGEMLNIDGDVSCKRIAAYLYKMAADKGHLNASFEYGKMLYIGDGIDINVSESIIYLKKAADGGNVNAMLIYSIILEEGDGIEKNLKEAFYYVKNAADNGNIEAMYKYGLMIDVYNQTDETKPSYYYFKKAADKGHLKAMYKYAQILENGIGVERNSIDAARYFSISADNGNIDSIYHIGLIYHEEIKPNRAYAAYCFKFAADAGNTKAMYAYGLSLYLGDGVKIDKKEAARYFKNAADKGHINAMKKLSHMLLTGDGIEINTDEAARYSKMAEEKPDS